MRGLSRLMVFACCAVLTACGGPRPAHVRQFPLTGEILTIKPDQSTVTVKHEDVKGFMPAMTMDFNIRESSLLKGLQAGDRITATLVVTDEDSYLTSIRKTGTVPLAERTPPPPAPVALLQPGDAVPDVVFSDDAGRPLRMSAYRGTYVLLTFIYTRCPLPDYCPRMNAHFAALQKAISGLPSLAHRLRLLSISFDPAYDTPAVLKAKAQSLGAMPALWRLVTAPRETVDAFGAALGLRVVREGSGGENITHNLRTVLVDPDGKLVKTYNGNAWTPDGAMKDLLDTVK